MLFHFNMLITMLNTYSGSFITTKNSFKIKYKKYKVFISHSIF